MLILETLAAGVPTPFYVAGNYFRVKSLTALVSSSLDVTFFKNGQRLETDLTDVDAGDRAFIRDGFDKFEVTSSVAQDVGLQVGRGDVGSDRITGEVSVIDGGKARTLSNSAFLGSVGVAAVAGQYAHAQLLNPAGSGVRAIVGQVMVLSAAGGRVEFNRLDAALTVAGPSAESKFFGGAASLCKMNAENNVALLGGTSVWIEMLVAGTTAPPFFPLEPIVLEPGKGLLARMNSVNSDLIVNFDFFEEAAS